MSNISFQLHTHLESGLHHVEHFPTLDAAYVHMIELCVCFTGGLRPIECNWVDDELVQIINATTGRLLGCLVLQHVEEPMVQH